MQEWCGSCFGCSPWWLQQLLLAPFSEFLFACAGVVWKLLWLLWLLTIMLATAAAFSSLFRITRKTWRLQQLLLAPYLELPLHVQEWCGSCCGCWLSWWLQQLLFAPLFPSELPLHVQEWYVSCCGCSPTWRLQQLLLASLLWITFACAGVVW